jgi:hypothetical protein
MTNTGVAKLEALGIGTSGPFVLLAGAGLSVWHPSSLPTWTEFNQVLLDEARARAERALPPKSPAVAALRSLNLQDIGSKALSNMLVEMLSGEAYFDVVNVLDSELPNDAHRAVARLAQRGVIAAIVTTNFDTLIERSLDDIGVRYTCYSAPQHYWSKKQVGLPIFKIHGSAGATGSLIDTVGQKLRGLAPLVRTRLAKVFAKHSVLALGYSGGDLEFGSDYLGLGSIPVGAERLWWMQRPGESTPLDAGLEQLVRSRGRFVEVSQADLLSALGAGKLHLEWNVASRAAMLGPLQAQTRAHFKKLGPLNTLAFCMRLLSATGQAGVAAELWLDIATKVRNRKRQTAGLLGPAMRALTAEGHRLFGIPEQREWACRQIRDIYARRSRPGANSDTSDPAYMRDARSEAHACLVMGETCVRKGDDYDAGVAMERAMDLCEWLADITLLPPVYRLYGWRELTRSKVRLQGAIVSTLTEAQLRESIVSEVTAFGYLLAAEAAGLVGGNIAPLDSAWISADFLVDLGEYDAAQICLERLGKRIGFGVSRETVVRIETLKGEIAFRQGQSSRAMEIWRTCLDGIARGNPLLEAYAKHVVVGRIGCVPEWRPDVLRYCDEILLDMDAGKLPADGRSDLLAARPYFEIVKRNLNSLGSAPLEPDFIQRLQEVPEGKEFWRWPEFYVRQGLIDYEFAGDSAVVLGLLDKLVGFTYLTGNCLPLRPALAHLRRAQLDGNDMDRFAAEANIAAIRHGCGDTITSSAWYAGALKSPFAKDPRVRRGLERHLPHALWDDSSLPRVAGGGQRTEIELEDALALQWRRPASGKEREKAAGALIAQNDFVIGRLMVLEAIAAYRDEGNVRGCQRAYELLRSFAQRDRRSGESPLSLC